MIIDIRYLPSGHITVTESGEERNHVYSLQPKMTFDRGDGVMVTPEADKPEGDPARSIPARPKLIQDICAAVWPLERTWKGNVRFITKFAVIVWDQLDELITPDNKQDLGLPLDIFAFADTIFPNEQAPATRLYRIKQRIEKLQNPKVIENVTS